MTILLGVLGTRRDGEAAARRYGINHIGFRWPGPDEGDPASTVVGMCDDGYADRVDEWFNGDPPNGVGPGSLLWFK